MTDLPPVPEPLPRPVVDNHCHLDIARDGEALPVDRALATAAEVGVTRIVQIGCDLERAAWAVEQAITSQAKMVAEHLKTQDIVVTTAQIPGRTAPRIVTAAMVESMKPGAIVLDMAAESGGNVEGSRPGETVTVGGVRIIGAQNLPARIAPATTVLYAKNLLTFVETLIDKKEKKLAVNWDDELVKATLLTRDGAVVHPNFQPKTAA